MHLCRYLLRTLAALLIASGVIAGIILGVYDDDDWRKVTIEAVERALACRVFVDGTFHLGLSVPPFISASGLRFEPLPGDPRPIVEKIDRIRITVSPASITAGNLVIKEVVVDGAALLFGGTKAPAAEREETVEAIADNKEGAATEEDSTRRRTITSSKEGAVTDSNALRKRRWYRKINYLWQRR